MYDDYEGDDYGEDYESYDGKHHVWGGGGDDADITSDYETYADLGASPYQLYVNCVQPTFETAGLQLAETVGLCLVYRGLMSLPKIRSSHLYRNYVNVVLGLVVLYRYFDALLLYVCAFSLALILLLALLRPYTHLFHVLLGLCILTITALEHSFTEFIQIRSVFMLMSIKALSLVHDFRSNLPLSFDVLGYLFNPGTILFGPFVTYKAYLDSIEKPAPLRLVSIAKHMLLTCAFLTATCLVMVFPTLSTRLLFVYRDALSFRVSHYFISSLSVVTYLICGYASYGNESPSKHADPTVFQPLSIEFPGSLKYVVSGWNRPLSHFLHKYIFQSRTHRNVFYNILATYVVSCGLHGFNMYITWILCSLCVYTYIEYKLRDKLTCVFNACCASSRCRPGCAHVYKSRSVRCVTINGVFMLLNIYHLAYLGCVLNNMDMLREEGMSWEWIPQRWINMNFVSHYLMFAGYVLYILV